MLSQREPGPQEQTVPGIGRAKEFIVMTRRKGRDTSLDEFTAAPRLLEGPEWETMAAALVDKRKSARRPAGRFAGPVAGLGDILELEPNVPVVAPSAVHGAADGLGHRGQLRCRAR